MTGVRSLHQTLASFVVNKFSNSRQVVKYRMQPRSVHEYMLSHQQASLELNCSEVRRLIDVFSSKVMAYLSRPLPRIDHKTVVEERTLIMN